MQRPLFVMVICNIVRCT